jgi:hypothetical protein
MRLRLTWLLPFAISIAVAASAAAQQGERRVALVIGNGAYQTAGTLDNPVNDARDMATKLSGLGFDVLRLENGTKQQMERRIEEFSHKLGRDAVSLFYYAGHGVQVNGHNFLVPVDARIETEQTVRLETVDLDVVLDQMSAAQSRVNLVILDACRNNPFEKRFRSVSGGLASIDAPAGTLIAYATAPGKVAADGQGRNALYTANLLRALDDPGLKVEDVFKHVRVAVSAASDGAQTPWESSSLTGDFYFKPARQGIAGAAPAPAPVPTTDTVFWESIKDSTNPADFADYLQQFPSGTFRSIAERRLAALGTMTAAKPPTDRSAPKTAAANPPAPQVATLPPTGPPAAPSRLSGKWTARDAGACATRSELSISDGRVTGYVQDHPRDVHIDAKLGENNELDVAVGAGDRAHPYLFRLKGKFPDIVMNGSSLCHDVQLTYRKVE